MDQKEFEKVLIEKFPLCVATNQPICSEMIETNLETSMSINEKVEAKLRAGIEPTIYEEQFCTIQRSLPGEIWYCMPNMDNKYKISNKRRVKSSSGILLQNKYGLTINDNEKYTRINVNNLVIKVADIKYIRFYNPLQNVISKVIAKEDLNASDISIMNINIQLPGEEWHPIPGYRGWYEISNLGRVKNIKRDYIMSLECDRYGYLYVGFHCRGTTKSIKVHRLVAKVFISKSEEDVRLGRDQVNHKDGNKLNNRVENLEWCTCSENQIHAVRTGLCQSRKISIDLLRKAVSLYRDKNMEIREIIKLPEFVGISYDKLYCAIFRRTYKSYTEIDIPETHSSIKAARDQK